MNKLTETAWRESWVNDLIHLLKQTNWQLIIDFVIKEKDKSYEQGYSDGKGERLN